MKLRQLTELTCNKRVANLSSKRYLPNIVKRGQLLYEKETLERNDTDYFLKIGAKLQG